MTLATHEEEVVDAEVVEDFNVDDVLKPRPVREVEVYAGPDDSVARSNLHQAGEIERGNRWSIARLIACSVDIQPRGANRFTSRVGDSHSMKLGLKDSQAVLRMDHRTIKTYLAAWDAAAEDGLCVPSDELSPEDGWTTPMPDPEDWQHYKAEASKPKTATCEGCHCEYAVASLNDTNVGPLCNECYDNRLEAKSFDDADWPEVPEPTQEEREEKFEQKYQELIDEGYIPKPPTEEERKAETQEFIQSLVGNRRTQEPVTAEDKFAKALNAVGAAIRINHGVNETLLNEDGWNVLRALGLR